MESQLIAHCSPTLASIKTGSLFSYAFASQIDLERRLRRCNRELGPKGVRVEALRVCEQRALIYVYRRTHLQADLLRGEAQLLLGSLGYPCGDADACLRLLRQRLDQGCGFPHEIGLFLGYPPADVAGFMANGGRNCKCIGCWKVYGDEDQAQRLFEKFRKCRRVYAKRFSSGTKVAQLTVAI